MEEEWMGWVAANSEMPLVMTPPGLQGPEHFQLSQGVATPTQAGEGIADPVDAWYESDNQLQSLCDFDGPRNQQAAQMSWPNARHDTMLSLMPQPQGAPVSRLPGAGDTLGGVELPRREVDLTQVHGQEGVLAIARDSVSTRRPEFFGQGAGSIFGSVGLQRREHTSIADAQGISSIDAGTTREGTLASRLQANPYLTEVGGQGG